MVTKMRIRGYVEPTTTRSDQFNGVECFLNIISWATFGCLDYMWRTAAPCGIPINIWISVMLAMLLVQIIVRLALYNIVRCCKSDGAIITVILWVVNAGWYGYGSWLYYGHDNDCYAVSEDSY